jgi:hypothetical protein
MSVATRNTNLESERLARGFVLSWPGCFREHRAEERLGRARRSQVTVPSDVRRKRQAGATDIDRGEAVAVKRGGHRPFSSGSLEHVA